MARVINEPKLFLTVEEVDILHKAKQVISSIEQEDINGEIFCKADCYETEWCWIKDFLSNLIQIAEVD